MAKQPRVRVRPRVRTTLNFAQLRMRIEKKQKAVLTRTGAWTRTVMQNSMPLAGGRSKRRNVSTPGRPPVARRGRGGGLRWVLFYVSMAHQSVIIGPGRTKPKTSVIRRAKSTLIVRRKVAVPRLLDRSGTADVTVQWHKSGQVDQQIWNYRRFPVSSWKPTRDQALKKFRELIKQYRL